MARSHAKILCRIWQDPDWCALKPREQWAFTLLLSQPRVSLVGVLDYMPGRWTNYGDGLTIDYIDLCLDGLEDAGYVCIDRSTHEILIRTFTRHDGIPITNERLRKGLWGAYEQVSSARLRKMAVDNMPDELFEFDVPDEAEHNRTSEPMEWVKQYPIDSPIEHPIKRVTDSPVALDLPPSALDLKPVTNHRANTPQVIHRPHLSAAHPPPVEQVLAARPERAPSDELIAGLAGWREVFGPKANGT